MITRQTNIIDSISTENIIKKYERLDNNNNNKSILSSLKEDKPLISSKPRSLLITRFFLHEDNSDHHLISRFLLQSRYRSWY